MEASDSPITESKKGSSGEAKWNFGKFHEGGKVPVMKNTLDKMELWNFVEL